MTGAIIGDIVGSQFRFNTTDVKDNVELFTNECSFTDHTICAVAIADAIMNNGSYQEALLDWCHRYPNPQGGYSDMITQWLKDPTTSTVSSFDNSAAKRIGAVGWLFNDYHQVLSESKRCAEVSHTHPEAIKGEGGYSDMITQWLKDPTTSTVSSFDNSAAKRIGAVGWLFNDYHQVLSESKRCAEVSHTHPEAIKGAQCVATLIYWLRTCRIRREEIEKAVKHNFGYEIPSLREIYATIHHGQNDAACQEIVPWSIRCFLESENFEDALRIAISISGDSVAEAVICGSIAEAYYQIPDELIEKAFGYLTKDILQIVEQYYEYLGSHLNK